MKTTRFKFWMALALALAGGWTATAQRTRMSGPAVPGPTDYEQFAQFITQRNIFNPQRYAVVQGQPPPVTRKEQQSAPSFTLVGTMSYEKGMFAFFDGNQSNLRKVLYQSESNSIAGYSVAEITLGGVTLQSADKKTVPLKIGQGMREVGGTWQLVAQGGYFGGGGDFGGGFGGRTRDFGGGGGGDYSAPPAGSSSPDTSAAPSSAIDGNDVLKRLMQQRQQELK